MESYKQNQIQRGLTLFISLQIHAMWLAELTSLPVCLSELWQPIFNESPSVFNFSALFYTPFCSLTLHPTAPTPSPRACLQVALSV